jgi:hypothetical protein
LPHHVDYETTDAIGSRPSHRRGCVHPRHCRATQRKVATPGRVTSDSAQAIGGPAAGKAARVETARKEGYAAGVAAERKRFADILSRAGGDAAIAVECFSAGHDRSKAAMHFIPHLERKLAHRLWEQSEVCRAMLNSQSNGYDPGTDSGGVATHATGNGDSAATGNLATSLSPAQQKVAAAIALPERKQWFSGWMNRQK